MSNELAVLENVNAVEVFVAGGTDKILQAIRDEVINDIPDTTTAKGRAEIASRAHKVAKSKVAIDKLGKELADKLNAQLKPINAERKKSKDTLEALKNEVREPLTIWEDAEKQRIITLKERLTDFDFSIDLFVGWTIDQVQFHFDTVAMTPIDETWQEFKSDAEIAKPIFIEKLTAYLAELVEKKKQEDELRKLQEEKAERERLEREEAIRKEATAKAEQEAKAAIKKAEQDKQDLIDKAARDKAQFAEQKKQAEINAKIAQEKAIEAERQRVLKEQEEEEKKAAKKAANVAHQKRINRAAMAEFVKLGLTEDQCKIVITAIAKHQIPSISINY